MECHPREGRLHKAQLRQRRDAIIKTDFLGDPAAFETENSRAGETHLPARRGAQRSCKKAVEGDAAVCAAAFPLADDIVAFSDEVRRATEVEVRKRRAKILA